MGRNARTLLPPTAIAALDSGAYAAGADKVYVSLELVSATDARILTGADFVVPLREVVGMLPPGRDEERPTAPAHATKQSHPWL